MVKIVCFSGCKVGFTHISLIISHILLLRCVVEKLKRKEFENFTAVVMNEIECFAALGFFRVYVCRVMQGRERSDDFCFH